MSQPKPLCNDSGVSFTPRILHHNNDVKEVDSSPPSITWYKSANQKIGIRTVYESLMIIFVKSGVTLAVEKRILIAKKAQVRTTFLYNFLFVIKCFSYLLRTPARNCLTSTINYAIAYVADNSTVPVHVVGRCKCFDFYSSVRRFSLKCEFKICILHCRKHLLMAFLLLV